MIFALLFIVTTFLMISTNQVHNAISQFAVITCLTVCSSDFFIVIILRHTAVSCLTSVLFSRKLDILHKSVN